MILNIHEHSCLPKPLKSLTTEIQLLSYIMAAFLRVHPRCLSNLDFSVLFNHIFPTIGLEESSKGVTMTTGPSGRLDSKD